jgi:PAS domain S-box-containing protein
MIIGKKSSIVLLFFAGVVVLILLGLYSYYAIETYKKSNESVEHAYVVIAEVQHAHSIIKEMASVSKTYVITGNKELLIPYHKSVDHIETAYGNLKNLASDPEVQHLLDSLHLLYLQKINYIDNVIDIVETEGHLKAEQIISLGEGNKIMEKIDAMVAKIIDRKESLLRSRTLKAKQEYDKSIMLRLGGLILAIFIIAAAGVMMIMYFNAMESAKTTLAQNIKELSITKEILDRTSRVAVIGGWEINIKNNFKMAATKITRDLYGVGPEYEFELESAINFFREGESRNAIKHAIENSIATGQPFDLDIELVSSTGRIIWVRAAGRTEFQNDQPSKVYGTFQDIDEIKKGQEERKLSEARFKAIFDSSFQLTVMLAKDGAILDINQASLKIRSYERKSVVGAFIWEIPSIANNKKNQDLIREAVAKAAEGTTSHLEMTTSFRDKTLTIDLFCKPIVDDNGNVMFLLAEARDITEQKKAEEEIRKQNEKLKASEEKFRTLAENMSDALTLTDAFNNFIYVSPSFQTLFGYSSEEILGQNGRNLVHPDDVERFKNEFLLPRSRGEKVDHYEIKIIKKDGSTGWGEFSTVPIKKDDQIIGFQTVSREISQRKLAEQIIESQTTELKANEEELIQNLEQLKTIQKELESQNERIKASEERYRLLSDNMTDTVTLVDAEDVFQYISLSGEKLFGYHSDELVKKKKGNDLVYQEDQERVKSEVMGQMRKGHSILNFQCRVVRKDSSLVWVEFTASPIFKENQIVGFQALVRDISERRKIEGELIESEKDLRRSQKIGKLGSWTSEVDNPNLKWSQTTYEIFGVPRGKPVTYSDFISIIHPKDRDTVSQAWAMAMIGGKYEVEYRIISNGNLKWIWATAEMEFDKNGDFVVAHGIVKDISDHKVFQESLRVAKEQAETANAAKSDFLANMSHEIRTPLNAVIGFTDLILQTELNASQKQYMTTVSQSAHSLLDIINDILDFSKIEAGKMDLVEENIDLQALVNQAANVISYQAQQKKLEVILTMDNDLPRHVMCDGIRLRQILVNLLGNAIKFTEEGEIELKVELIKNLIPNTNARSLKSEIAYPDSGTIRFSVRDTGIGINQDKMQKIFKAFEQADNYTTKKFGGTGLGLAINNRLLALMGSKLQLQSEIGKGSVFFFDLKLNCIGESPLDLDKSKTSKQELDVTIGNSNSGCKKIMLVDDNPINLALAKAIVKKMWPDVALVEAVDGRVATEKFVSEKPNLVLMDIQMPVMNGYEATMQIRTWEKENAKAEGQNHNGANSDRIPIIALTAGTVKGEAQRCLDAGMDDYVSKPIVGDSLQKVITKWLFSQEKLS